MKRDSRMTASARRTSASGAVFVFGALIAALVLGAVGGCGGDGETPRDVSRRILESLPGALYDPPKPAPALRLSGDAGAAFDLATERGRVVLVYFGFTNCPDVCTIVLKRWAKVRAELGADTSRVRFVFVSVDPEHDTPAVAAAYARRFDPSFLGVSGTEAEIGEIALAWGIAKGKAHTTQVFVVNPEGLIPWGYGSGATVEEIVLGIRAVGGARPRL